MFETNTIGPLLIIQAFLPLLRNSPSARIINVSSGAGQLQTDMRGSAAPRSVEEGAEGIVWLATEASTSLTGQFIKDRKAIPW
jgi:hypothetical protein